MAIKLLLFDLDGTIYIGQKLLPGIKELIEKLNRNRINYGFMTNNSSVAPLDYLQKLNNLGLNTRIENIITSSEATCIMLKEMALGPDIFIFGTERFKNYLKTHGYRHNEKNPDAVLVGFDLEMTYEKLIKATRLVNNGIPLVASHPDVTCPSPDGPIPDAGMLLAAIEAGTNVKPIAIAGKPNRWIIEVAKQHFNVQPGEIMIVGDRLQTDMKMGLRFNMKTALVLTGVTKKDDLERSDIKPDYVFSSAAEIAKDFYFDKLLSSAK